VHLVGFLFIVYIFRRNTYKKIIATFLPFNLVEQTVSNLNVLKS
jgi:hypothetical protein